MPAGSGWHFLHLQTVVTSSSCGCWEGIGHAATGHVVAVALKAYSFPAPPPGSIALLSGGCVQPGIGAKLCDDPTDKSPACLKLATHKLFLLVGPLLRAASTPVPRQERPSGAPGAGRGCPGDPPATRRCPGTPGTPPSLVGQSCALAAWFAEVYAAGKYVSFLVGKVWCRPWLPWEEPELLVLRSLFPNVHKWASHSACFSKV